MLKCMQEWYLGWEKVRGVLISEVEWYILGLGKSPV